MRPDEHKKKKNAAYKKKHGIGQNKGHEEESGIKNKNLIKGKRTVEQSQPGTNDHIRHGASASSKGSGLNSSSDESDSARAEKTTSCRKTYQKRQIVSNWEKYEPQSLEDEKPEKRGENFETLLSMAGDAAAHFRFKDEQNWESEACSAAGGEGADLDPLAQYLTIDSHQLGQTLSCLPLYKVMGLTPDIFPEDEVILMERSAAEQREKYMPSESSQRTACLSETSLNLKTAICSKLSDKFATECNQSQHKTNMLKKCVRDDHHSDKPLNSSTTNTNKGLTLVADNAHTEAIIQNEVLKTGINISETVSGNSVQSLSLDDHDLDELLDLDVPDLDKAEKEKNETNRSSGKTDAVVFVTEQYVTPADRQTNQVQQTLQKQEKDGVDLEDWLDSILDD